MTRAIARPRPSVDLPSAPLLAAALAGLGFAPLACESNPSAEPDPCPDAMDSVGSAATSAPETGTTLPDPSDPTDVSASSSGPPGTTTGMSATDPVDPGTTTEVSEGSSSTGGTGDTGEPAGCEPPEVVSEVETKQTFTQYTADCDELGGYVQIQAACSGVNSCAGFSIGDWDPDVRTDHTCRGMNGCAGLSCVVTPPDSGLTGEQILALAAIPNGQPDDVINGPAPCVYCHAEYVDDVPDSTVFRLHLLPGSTRTAENWLDRSAAEMERIVAFGSHGVTPDGIAYASMVGYAKSLSRAEIERVVAHIRTLEPVIHEIKFDEP